MTKDIYDVMSHAGMTERELFLRQLSSVSLIDIGIVTSFSAVHGTATVRALGSDTAHPTEYTDVEVLWPGSSQNGLTGNIVNGLALILTPRTTTELAREANVVVGTQHYSKAGAKCIPVYSGTDAPVSVSFDPVGNFVMSVPDLYQFALTEENISLSWGVGRIQASIDAEGVLTAVRLPLKQTMQNSRELVYRDETNKIVGRDYWALDGTHTVQSISQAEPTPEQEDDLTTYTDFIWTTETAPDGTITRTLRSASDEQVLQTITASPDSSITIEQSDGSDTLNTVTVSAEGDITLTNKGGTTISIGVDGTISIEAGGDVTLTSENVTLDGTVSVTGDLSVDGSLTVSGDGTIDGSFSGGGGALTADA